MFGSQAVNVSPRTGHLHVAVDGAQWVWAGTSGGPIIIAGLPPGITQSLPIILSDTAVVITGLDTVTGVRDEKPFSAVGRVTFVVAKRGADWQIVHFHRSAMPN